jgi:hypothetical protein
VEVEQELRVGMAAGVEGEAAGVEGEAAIER